MVSKDSWDFVEDPFSVAVSPGVEGEKPSADLEAPATPTGAWHESFPQLGKIKLSALQLVGSATGMVWVRAAADEVGSTRQEEDLEEQESLLQEEQDAALIDEHMHELHEKVLHSSPLRPSPCSAESRDDCCRPTRPPRLCFLAIAFCR